MKRTPIVGDRVVIVSTLTNTYGGKYVGECGVVCRTSPSGSGRFGISLDNHNNAASSYGAYWFKETEIEIIDNEEDMNMNEVKCVKITFVSDVQAKCRHNFAVYEDEIAVGDYVVVKTAHHGMCVGIVDELIDTGIADCGREVVCKFDIAAYAERKEKRKKVAELQRKMSQRFNELQKIAVYEMMAQTDEQMKAMLDELKSLQ